MSALTSGGGNNSPLSFEYLGSFTFEEGEGWKQLGAIFPYDTGIDVDTSSVYAIIAIPMGAKATNTSRTGGFNYCRNAEYDGRSDTYKGWSDTSAKMYVTDGRLYIGNSNYNFFWKGAYHVYGISLRG